MEPENITYTGILTLENGKTFLRGKNDHRYFADAAIWSGYIRHWINRKLNGILLPETDYETGKRIVLLWPYGVAIQEPFIELYYNERLLKYFYSFLGHTALNINGRIFNFSHLINECEVINEAEYFYRPALGKFAPCPGSGFNMDDPEHPYLDKFGRQFMRTIHVAKVTGVDTGKISEFLYRELENIKSTPEDPERPGVYRDFNILTRSCTTIIRDSLRQGGFPETRGIFPRDMFVSTVYYLRKRQEKGELNLSVYTKQQFIVDEATASSRTPLINPLNRLRISLLNKKGIFI